MTVDDLSLPAVLKKFPLLKKGLVLVTGPTGSGKSTTLAAMMDYANLQRHDHIITVEDPIEFVHRSQNCLVQHREVGVHTRSFANALRGALREDPDILLVGEMPRSTKGNSGQPGQEDSRGGWRQIAQTSRPAAHGPSAAPAPESATNTSGVDTQTRNTGEEAAGNPHSTRPSSPGAGQRNTELHPSP